jgi:hypothetical protein
MNVELLQQVKQAILAEPDKFRMDRWSCGTAHCIAGWACLLRDIPIVEGDFTTETVSGEYPGLVASKLLDLRGRAADKLFYTFGWPSRFRAPYLGATRRERAEIAAERIDHFIATDGRE